MTNYKKDLININLGLNTHSCSWQICRSLHWKILYLSRKRIRRLKASCPTGWIDMKTTCKHAIVSSYRSSRSTESFIHFQCVYHTSARFVIVIISCKLGHIMFQDNRSAFCSKIFNAHDQDKTPYWLKSGARWGPGTGLKPTLSTNHELGPVVRTLVF